MLRNKLQKDVYFMKMALAEAVKGATSAWPNPMVGVVVVKNGKVLAKGFHKKPRQPHAEVNALVGFSKNQLKGSIVYVTLEPCCHLNKRTPPCTNFLLNLGIKELVIAMRDPNPNVAGLGIRQLRRSGVRVKVGVLEKEAWKLNEKYCYVMERKFPFVAIKLGMTLDARIATSLGESQWITGEISRKYVHLLRSQYDAVLTSSETVLSDNPELSVRLVKGKQPFRVILDRTLKTDPNAKVYRDRNVLVFTTDKANTLKMKKFIKLGIEVKVFSEQQFHMKNILRDLYKRSIFSLMLEAGGTLASILLKEKYVQKVYFFYAPKILGAEAKPGIGPLSITALTSVIHLQDLRVERLGDDFMIEASL